MAIAFAGTALLAAAEPQLSRSARGGFELAAGVQVDEADSALRAQLERVRRLLDERHWDEAIDGLRQLADTEPHRLVAASGQRYVPVQTWCQWQLLGLPPDALQIYRRRADPQAKQWYERGIAQRDRAALENVVNNALASSYGDKALLALADICLESADYPTARHYLRQILPPQPNATPGQPATAWPSYPDTSLEVARVRAILILASILEGSLDRAADELDTFTSLHPQATGRLGLQDGTYVDLLGKLLAASREWPQPPTSLNWTTFAGNPQRNKIAPALIDAGAVAWQVTLQPKTATDDALSPKPLPSATFYPVVTGDLVLINSGDTIQAFDRRNGNPAWANTPIIYSTVNLAQESRVTRGADHSFTPSQTLTVFRNLLFARMRGKVDHQGQDVLQAGRGEIVCLDLTAEGMLLWKAEPEDGWAFEGTPVVDDQGVYIGMRRRDTRSQAFVACYSPDTGRLRWRTFVCSADVPPPDIVPERRDGLLTLAGETVYCNTNQGAVAALDRRTGHIHWLSLYDRASQADGHNLACHWKRSANPCVLAGDTLVVAPTDSPRVFAFDAFGGQLLWHTGANAEDIGQLLGVTQDRLIAAGKRLYWISLRDRDGGRIVHRWPSDGGVASLGRGLLTSDTILWPMRNGVQVLDTATGQPRKLIELSVRGATGGTLLSVGDQLLITTNKELTSLGPNAGKRRNHP